MSNPPQIIGNVKTEWYFAKELKNCIRNSGFKTLDDWLRATTTDETKLCKVNLYEFENPTAEKSSLWLLRNVII